MSSSFSNESNSDVIRFFFIVVNFLYPDATVRVLDGIELYCEKYGVKDISELIGGMKQ